MASSREPVGQRGIGFQADDGAGELAGRECGRLAEQAGAQAGPGFVARGAAGRDAFRRWHRAARVELRQLALQRADVALQGGEGFGAVPYVGVEPVEPLAGGGDGFARGQGDAGQHVEIRDSGREAGRGFRERAALRRGFDGQLVRRFDPLQRAGHGGEPLAKRAGIAQRAAAFALALLVREVLAFRGELALRGGERGVAPRRFVEQRFEAGAVGVAGLAGEHGIGIGQAEPDRQRGEIGGESIGLALHAGQVGARLQPRARLRGQPLDLVGMGEHGGVGGEARLGGDKLRFCADRCLAARPARGQRLQRRRKLGGEALGHGGERAERGKLRLRRVDQPDDGRGPPDALEAGLLRRDLDAAGPRRLVRAGLLLDAVAQLLQRAAAKLAFAQRGARVLVPVEALVERAVLRSALGEDAVGLLVERRAEVVEAAQAGCGGEQGGAELAVALLQVLAAGAQGFRVEAEGAAEHLARQPAEERRERVVRQGRVAAVDQHRLVLAAAEGERAAGAVGDGRADAQVLAGVDEIEARARLDAEEEVRDGGERAAFPGLVRAVDDMQLRVGPEGEALAGERAVAFEIEFEEAHVSRYRRRRGRWRAPAHPRRAHRDRRVSTSRSSMAPGILARICSIRVAARARMAGSFSSPSSRAAGSSAMPSGTSGLECGGSLVSMRSRSSHTSSRWWSASAWTSSRNRGVSAFSRRCSGVAPESVTRSATSRSPASSSGVRSASPTQARNAASSATPARSTATLAQRALSTMSGRTPVDVAVRDVDQHRALGSAFAHAAALEIAGEDDPRIARQHLELMHMAERPVVIAARCEVLHRARRVGGVGRAALARGVQQADIEPAFDRRRVGEGEIFAGHPVREAAAVHRDLQGFEPLGRRLVRRELEHAGGQRHGLGDLALRVVIALDDEDRDVGPAEARDLPVEEQADARVLPLAVVDVAREHGERDILLDGAA